MIAISILVWIVKGILYVFLGVLLLVLLAAGLILFVPIRYSCKADVQEEMQDVYLQMSWLLGFVTFVFQWDEPDATGLRIFGFRIGKPAETDSESDESGEEDEDDEEDNEEDDEELEAAAEDFFTEENSNGILNRVQEIVDKVNYVVHYPDRNLIIQYSLDLVRKLMKAIIPKTCKITGTIGTGDACQTGQVLGGLYAVSGLVGLDAKLAGDFEKKNLVLAIGITGKITLWELVFPLVIYITKKPIWKIVKHVLFRRE